MNRLLLTCAGLTVGVSLAFTPKAFAQTSLNDVAGAITQGSQFDEARELVDQRRQSVEDEAIIDGEPGVFVLKKSEIFTVSASAGGGYSSNPARTLDTGGESAFANLALRAGINTVINQTYDAGLNVVASATDYQEDFGPTSRTGVANAFVGRSVWDNRIYVSGSLVAGVSTSEDLRQGRAFYGASLNGAYVHKLSDRLFFRPSLTLSKQLAGESEQDNISATASANLIWQATPNWGLSGQLAYTYREYDDFFEDVTFVKRQDDHIRLGVSASRTVFDKVNLALSYDYTTQDSSFFLSEYESHDGGLSLQVSRRF